MAILFAVLGKKEFEGSFLFWSTRRVARKFMISGFFCTHDFYWEDIR
jgi:hypothetical protein